MSARLITLNQMRASEEISEEQSRQVGPLPPFVRFRAHGADSLWSLTDALRCRACVLGVSLLQVRLHLTDVVFPQILPIVVVYQISSQPAPYPFSSYPTLQSLPTLVAVSYAHYSVTNNARTCGLCDSQNRGRMKRSVCERLGKKTPCETSGAAGDRAFFLLFRPLLVANRPPTIFTTALPLPPSSSCHVVRPAVRTACRPLPTDEGRRVPCEPERATRVPRLSRRDCPACRGVWVGRSRLWGLW